MSLFEFNFPLDDNVEYSPLISTVSRLTPFFEDNTNLAFLALSAI